MNSPLFQRSRPRLAAAAFAFTALANLLAGAALAEDAAFRVRFGFRDAEASSWDGSVAVEGGGRLVSVEGWRFEQTDQMTSETAWKATSRPITIRKSRSNNKLRAGGDTKPIRVPMTDNGVIVRVAEATADTKVNVKTARGDFAFSLADVALG
ncbi:MAG: hypothetical protein H7A53_12955, partial [Akkermansiaceae bacterium]|nr:hypothetical protein [Akkermansiaceae bacterium]